MVIIYHFIAKDMPLSPLNTHARPDISPLKWQLRGPETLPPDPLCRTLSGYYPYRHAPEADERHDHGRDDADDTIHEEVYNPSEHRVA